MRLVVIGIALLLLVTTGGYATALTTGTISALGGGSSNVAHCQVVDYDVAVSDTISSVNANVECDLTGTYSVDATVTSGSSGSGQTTGVSLTAGVPLVVAITISPSVTISATTYSADIQVKN